MSLPAQICLSHGWSLCAFSVRMVCLFSEQPGCAFSGRMDRPFSGQAFFDRPVRLFSGLFDSAFSIPLAVLLPGRWTSFGRSDSVLRNSAGSVAFVSLCGASLEAMLACRTCFRLPARNPNGRQGTQTNDSGR